MLFFVFRGVIFRWCRVCRELYVLDYIRLGMSLVVTGRFVCFRVRGRFGGTVGFRCGVNGFLGV